MRAQTTWCWHSGSTRKYDTIFLLRGSKVFRNLASFLEKLWIKKLEVQKAALVGGFVSLHDLKCLLREFLRKEHVCIPVSSNMFATSNKSTNIKGKLSIIHTQLC